MKTPPLKGLVLIGGKSQRMGRDKSGLAYHGKPQALYAYELLEKCCEQTFLSCREEQTLEAELQNLPQIHDAYNGIGPMGGILSAMEKDQHAAWLILACDLPFLSQKTLQQLVNKRDPTQKATCFLNLEKGWKEPLCAIWEPQSRDNLLQGLNEQKYCPRRQLKHMNTKDLTPESEKALENVNTPEEFQVTQNLLKERT